MLFICTVALVRLQQLYDVNAKWPTEAHASLLLVLGQTLFICERYFVC